MAVGPKYLKYGTWVRLLELKEVRPKQNSHGQYRDWIFGKPRSHIVGILLLSGVPTAAWESVSLFVRADVSLDKEASLLSTCFGTCGNLSGFDRARDLGAGSGEELSTARELCWLLGSCWPARGAGARVLESDCDRRWAVESL